MNKLITKLPKSLAAFLAFVFTLVFTTITYAGDAPSAGNIAEGQKIFKANCAACHSLGANKVVGPGLQGVIDRVPSQDWMLSWIKNNNALRKSGDAYANKVFTDNNGAAMTVFDGQLTDDQIKNVIAFLAHPPAPETAGGGDQGAKTGSAQTAENSNDEHPGMILLLIIGVLFIIIVVLRTVRRSLLSLSNEKKGLPPLEDIGLWKETVKWIKTHKVHFAVINIFVVVVFVVYGWEYLWGINVTPGYQPSQPINFRHDIHAGKNGIACIYCHSGAEKGKVAGIPTLNVCMNCHRGIQGSNPEFQKEIAKIYDAVGWDPNKADYTNPKHPIKWNRVHALPDFAYFNHSQHVSVGKLDCKNCHGDVATFTTDKQFATLTMGWCVDCHRATPVHMDGNGYYTKLHDVLMKQDSTRKITEADMGGLECGKCHY